MMTDQYVYAYDVYGGVTYFKISDQKLPRCARYSGSGGQFSSRCLEDSLSKIAAQKLGVGRKDVRLGQYSREPFDQGHLPSNVYRQGRWRSYTWD